MYEELGPDGSAVEDDAQLDRIAAEGPRGAMSLAGVAVAIVVAIWFAFYLLVFVPRG